MNQHYPRNYHKISDTRNQPPPALCPITGNKIDAASAVEFQINGKKIRVCSVDCMKRIKNLYNLIQG